MRPIPTLVELRRTISTARISGRSIGFIPTMGALHEGHLSLIRTCRQRGDFALVSIFVNPTQFGPHEDFNAYPRPMEDDLQKCRAAGADAVFTPDSKEIYPGETLTRVSVSRITEHLCGAHRPGHFDGVTLVVAKLFNMVQPDRAYFGEKDYQQLRTIQRMVQDLFMPIEIVACPTVREPDGLALSSRNAYLTPAQRRQAPAIHAALAEAAGQVAAGEKNCADLNSHVRRRLAEAGIADIDYVETVDAMTLERLATVDREARILVAARLGSCRLIDNVSLA